MGVHVLGRMPSARLAVLAAVVLVAGLTGCGSGESVGSPGPGGAATRGTSASTSVATNVPADATTRRIAEVEFVRQCEVATQSFPKESDLDADLAARLKTAGIAHLAWKDWHDALVTSPQLVSQLSEVGRGGCPKG